jgi:hypothetical protein
VPEVRFRNGCFLSPAVIPAFSIYVRMKGFTGK